MCAQVTELRMRLSDRMQVIADHVAPGEAVADIGTDHGQIPVWLFARGISPRVILSDISEGSIQKAKETAAAYQFGDRVSFRVGDGLEVLAPAEVDTVIIAGMGGKLIRQILDRNPDHTKSFGKFILQPRKGAGPLRQWLLRNGFRIVCEDVVREGHFIPEIITAIPPGSRGEEADSPATECRTAANQIPVPEQNENGSTGGATDCPATECGTTMNRIPAPEQSKRWSTGARDLAGEHRQVLVGLPEEDIRLRVPPWMTEARGPLEDYLDLRIGQEQLVLTNIRRARTRSEEAENRVQENIRYLQQLKSRIRG